MLRLLFLLSFTLILIRETSAQYIPNLERGDETARRQSNIDTNNVSTSIFNFGFSGRTKAVPYEYPYEWPAYSDREYVALKAMFIGGEVINTNGDTIHIVDLPTYRDDPQGGSWNLEPVPEYLNLSSGYIARSDDPSTWPSIWIDKLNDLNDPGWPGAWNSFWGKNIFTADQEFYYHASDDLYDRHSFYPDSTDSTRRGLGLIVSQRVMAFDFFPDELFFITDIYNVGDYDIEKAALTLWIADIVGGDANDDTLAYDLSKQIAYFCDADGHGTEPFGTDTVGVAALAFIQTPYKSFQPDSIELGITGIIQDPAGNINFNTVSDQFLWNKFMTPGHFYVPNPTGEYDQYISISYFPIPSGKFQRVVTAMVFGQNIIEIDNKIDLIKSTFRGMLSGIPNLNFSISRPTPGQVVSGQTEIEWNVENNNPAYRLSILFSEDLGKTWQPLANDLPNTGIYLWDTNNQPDGIFNKIKIVAWGDSSFGILDSDSVFTINNSAPAAPQILLTSPQKDQTYQGRFPVDWIAGDADGDTVHIDLSYTIENSNISDTIAMGLSNTGIYNWQTASLPNSAFYKLNALISDGQLSGSDSVFKFEIRNPRINLDDSTLIQRNTIGTGLIEVHIVDSTQLTGHNYRVQFNVPSNDSTTYDVLDVNTASNVVTGATQVNGIREGPFFDGMRLLIQNDNTELNSSQSGWNNNDVYDFKFNLFNFYLFIEGNSDPADYRLEIGNVGIDTSTVYDILFLHLPAKPVNFKIINTTTGQPIDFAFDELDGNDGRFTIDTTNANLADQIVFLKKDDQDSLVITWQTFLNTNTGSRNPQIGDTLYLNLFKAFQDSDQYSFQAILTEIDEDNILPSEFALYQNYPNPFNPETTIRFQIGSTQNVSLVIYDILGRKVRTLVDQKLNPSVYRISWDGRSEEGKSVASGVYFYRLKVGNSKSSSGKVFVKTRKMLLIK